MLMGKRTRKYTSRKGNNLIEYAVTSVLVGLSFVGVMQYFNPSLLSTVMLSTFSGRSVSSGVVTLTPIGNADLTGISELTYHVDH